MMNAVQRKLNSSLYVHIHVYLDLEQTPLPNNAAAGLNMFFTPVAVPQSSGQWM